MFLFGFGGLFWSEKSVESGIASLLVATIPVWIALIEVFIFKNGSLQQSLVGAIVLGLAGVALLTFHGGHLAIPFVPVLVLTFGQVAWAFGTVLSSKLQLPDSKIASAGYQMTAGGILLAIASHTAGEIVMRPHVSGQAMLGLLYLAVPGSVLAFTAYIWLLKRLSPTVVGSYAYVNPVVALVVGYVFGDGVLGVRTLIGSALIIASVVVTLTFRSSQISSNPPIRPKASDCYVS